MNNYIISATLGITFAFVGETVRKLEAHSRLVRIGNPAWMVPLSPSCQLTELG